MKSQPRRGIGAAPTLILPALALVVLLARPGSTRAEFDDATPVDPPQDRSAVVAFLHESGGFSILGLQITGATHSVEVLFITDPGCSALIDSGDPWPAPHRGCSGPTGIVGKVGGLGVTMSGDSLVGVEIEVPRACHELLVLGMPWPPDLAECRSDRIASPGPDLR